MKPKLSAGKGKVYNWLPMFLYKALVKHRHILPFYHSVSDKPGPHISNLGYSRKVGDFRNDVDFLKTNFKTIGIDQLSPGAGQRGFFFSFDDGLADIYQNALPYLRSRKIPAAIFVNSDFVDNKNMFYRHKASLLLEAIKTENQERILADFLETKAYKVESLIKAATNNDDSKLDAMAGALGLDFKVYLDNFKPYLTTNQLIELKDEGFIIGNHTQNHQNLKDLSFENQIAQIEECNRFLTEDLGVDDLYFSFPFGDEGIKNEVFEYLYGPGKIKLSFGVSGLKRDDFERHLHRIPMELGNKNSDSIIKSQYFYFLAKSLLGRNRIQRKA